MGRMENRDHASEMIAPAHNPEPDELTADEVIGEAGLALLEAGLGGIGSGLAARPRRRYRFDSPDYSDAEFVDDLLGNAALSAFTAAFQSLGASFGGARRRRR